MERTLVLRTAQTLGLGASATLLGAGFAITVQAIPAILLSPRDLLLRQWRTIYDVGIAYGPPFAVTSCLSLGYVAYDSYGSDSADWMVYAFSALCTVGIVPFTKLTLDDINATLIAEGGVDGGSNVLMAKKTEAKGLEEKEVRELVKRWWFWNLMRMMMPLVGTVMGLWTALK
ncbi:hypothetical protein HO173_006209 [Letharia columbiana]|uniref:DUF1772-domain-containing protein n=1 Tax=Letharia columbiana TaxID=112416 RepID=A0A8H6FVN5_9LECA|nr:uncharacterized protein HO173_006209 [Letharia columbiana]KAF6235526.1 hypothetical protein HO173_006209 [Letharia columbiana]